MREESKDVLILYDTEEEYAGLMTDFLKSRKDLPWEIRTYTVVELLLKEEKPGQISMLVAAEGAYCDDLQALQPLRTVILNESGMVKWGQLCQVNKYQQADKVLKELLEIYMEVAPGGLPQLWCRSNTRFIGMYSPVKRCLQTSVALTMSQMLAEEHRTLYLNFEHYAGITELLPEVQNRDMADLLYFLNVEQGKFRLRMQTIVQKKGKLDYVPPMRSGQNLLTVSAAEWMQFIQKLAELGEYEYVVLDLSDSIQGLFDILRNCHKIFTLTADDRIAKSKLLQYEQLLGLYEYEDVLQKTCRSAPPHIRRLPEEPEQYVRGELAEYVRRQLKEIIGDEDKGV